MDISTPVPSKNNPLTPPRPTHNARPLTRDGGSMPVSRFCLHFCPSAGPTPKSGKGSYIGMTGAIDSFSRRLSCPRSAQAIRFRIYVPIIQNYLRLESKTKPQCSKRVVSFVFASQAPYRFTPSLLAERVGVRSSTQNAKRETQGWSRFSRFHSAPTRNAKGAMGLC